MAILQPIYTADKIKSAFQLNWSLTIFWRERANSADWLDDLKAISEADGVRILEHRFVTPTVSMLLVSTRPCFVPQEIPRVVKGRLQFLVRQQRPKAFQRNYDLRSIGSTTRDKTEAYVETQLRHHMAGNPSLAALLADLQIINTDVNLASPRFTGHARYWNNLHMVFVHDWRTPETNIETWLRVREVLRKSAISKGWLLSRVGFVPDHIHLTLGVGVADSPLNVALSFMNNIAFAHKMRPVLMPSCYIGTIGEYDLGAIQRRKTEGF